MINFFNDERFSDIAVVISGQKFHAHKIFLLTQSSYFQKVLEGSPTVSRCKACSCGAIELTREQISEIVLSSEHDSTAALAFLDHMYSAHCFPARHHTLVFLAEMYLVAMKHGRRDAADDFEADCLERLMDEEFSDQYFSDVTALCGPDSSRYADTSIQAMVFETVLRNVKYMDDESAETFKKKYNEGVLFNTEFTRRFGMLMLDRFRRYTSSNRGS